MGVRISLPVRCAWRGTMLGLMLAFAGAAPAGAPENMPIEEIVRGLASADFAQRERAQKELEGVGWQARGQLVRIAEAQVDAEVKARLDARVLQIDEQLAVDPPPVALHLKGASLQEAARALGEQIGMTVSLSPTTDAAQKPITLDKEGAFWDVCAELGKYNVARMAISREDRSIYSGPILRSYDREGGFLTAAMSVTLNQRVDAQAAPGVDPLAARLVLQLVSIADPRTRLVAMSALRVTTAVDELGNNLLKNPPPAGVVAMADATGRMLGSAGVELQVLPGRGKMLAVVKGEIRFEVLVREARRVIEAVDKHVNEPMVVGTQEVTVTQFDVKEGELNMVLRAVPVNGAPQQSVEATLVDGNGAAVWTDVLRGENGTGLSTDRAGPFKLIMTVPEKTKMIVVPFELKNVPLPG